MEAVRVPVESPFFDNAVAVWAVFQFEGGILVVVVVDVVVVVNVVVVVVVVVEAMHFPAVQ